MQYAKFTESSLNTTKVVICMQAVITFFEKLDGGVTKYKEFMFGCLKLSIPTDDGIPWCFVESKDCVRLAKLTQRMYDSKVFKRAREAANGDLLMAKPATEPKAKKKGGKAKAKANPKSKAPDVSMQKAEAIFMDDALNALCAS
eukprot:7094208-Pyramimonas_sp.AAC.1